MKLHHLHLPGLTPYTHASYLQESLVSRFLAAKRTPSIRPPPPTLLTFSPPPTYTAGRREAGTVSTSQKKHLLTEGRAEFHETLRGGQTTFHGPGQLVAYPILDLRTHGLSPRCYVRLLEDALIATCARYGVRAFTTENTGVWTSAEEKIAAVGVHMRRNITSHGIGLNVSTDLWWFDRIVACGLKGKRATSLQAQGIKDKTVQEVGEVWEVFGEEVAERLEGVDGVEAVVAEKGDELGVLERLQMNRYKGID